MGSSLNIIDILIPSQGWKGLDGHISAISLFEDLVSGYFVLNMQQEIEDKLINLLNTAKKPLLDRMQEQFIDYAQLLAMVEDEELIRHIDFSPLS